MLRPVILGMRGSTVIRLRPCMLSSTPLPPTPTGALPIPTLTPTPQSQQPVWSNTDTLDGGKVWKKTCAGNPMTFENIYNSNHTTDVFAVESARTAAADKAWETLGSC